MTTINFISKSEEETKTIGRVLASLLEAGDVITLSGDLGAGKTTFTKGIALGLNIEQPITSPTFTIIKEYDGKLRLNHMDAYRLEYSEEDLGFDEYFFGDGVTVVEWATFIEDYLPEQYLAITIERIDEHERSLSFTSSGDRYYDLLKQLENSELRGFLQ